MSRKKREDEKENLERWMVSYADFITLLFAFFVVMYSISSVNQNKYVMLSSAIGIAFGGAGNTIIQNENHPLPILLKSNRKEKVLQAEVKREREKMAAIGKDLMDALSPLISQGKVRVMQTSRGVNVEISASVLFAPGDAQLDEQSAQTIKAVGAVLKDVTNTVQVEGFTDNVPINTVMFPSNWELSAVRASSVVRLLIESGMKERQLTAIGRGANYPIESNATPEGRSRNRRVQLMVLSNITEEAKEVFLKNEHESSDTHNTAIVPPVSPADNN